MIIRFILLGFPYVKSKEKGKRMRGPHGGFRARWLLWYLEVKGRPRGREKQRNTRERKHGR